MTELSIQSLEGGLEVYSARCSPSAGESGPCPMLTALAVRPDTPDYSMPPFRCAAWYVNQGCQSEFEFVMIRSF